MLRDIIHHRSRNCAVISRLLVVWLLRTLWCSRVALSILSRFSSRVGEKSIIRKRNEMSRRRSMVNRSKINDDCRLAKAYLNSFRLLFYKVHKKQCTIRETSVSSAADPQQPRELKRTEPTVLLYLFCIFKQILMCLIFIFLSAFILFLSPDCWADRLFP